VLFFSNLTGAVVQIDTVFMLGLPSDPSKRRIVEPQIREEQEMYGDLLIMPDAYREPDIDNRMQNIYFGWQHVALVYDGQYDFVMHADKDVFYNWPVLVELPGFLPAKASPRFIFGREVYNGWYVGHARDSKKLFSRRVRQLYENFENGTYKGPICFAGETFAVSVDLVKKFANSEVVKRNVEQVPKSDGAGDVHTCAWISAVEEWDLITHNLLSVNAFKGGWAHSGNLKNPAELFHCILSPKGCQGELQNTIKGAYN
jgi:hypothetical protein